MKRLMALILALLLMAGVAYAKGLEVKQKAGDYNVEIRLDKNPPVVGKNGMEIEIKDGAGRNVTDAKVLINYTMPAMQGMPAMNYKTNAPLAGAKYAATLNLSMSGPWGIAVKITKSGKSSTVRFNVDAQ